MQHIELLTSFELDTPRLVKCMEDNAPHLLEREIFIRRFSDLPKITEGSWVLIFEDDPLFEDIVAYIQNVKVRIAII